MCGLLYENPTWFSEYFILLPKSAHLSYLLTLCEIRMVWRRLKLYLSCYHPPPVVVASTYHSDTCYLCYKGQDGLLGCIWIMWDFRLRFIEFQLMFCQRFVLWNMPWNCDILLSHLPIEVVYGWMFSADLGKLPVRVIASQITPKRGNLLGIWLRTFFKPYQSWMRKEMEMVIKQFYFNKIRKIRV